MNAKELTIVVNKACFDVFDYSISEYGELVILDLYDMDEEGKYVHAVDCHADLFIDNDEDTVSYMIENGIAAVCLR